MLLPSLTRHLVLVASLVSLCSTVAMAQPRVEEIEIQGDLRRVAESPDEATCSALRGRTGKRLEGL